ncbi:hypothetical protein Syun_031280 [Stephania yunnanensis]|uniref:Uncharacterized protein n=1 Tax=Stephania yunnanensis TaxID=152371 RepID=A0AAP0DWR4_9MAGN
MQNQMQSRILSNNSCARRRCTHQWYAWWKATRMEMDSSEAAVRGGVRRMKGGAAVIGEELETGRIERWRGRERPVGGGRGGGRGVGEGVVVAVRSWRRGRIGGGEAERPPGVGGEAVEGVGEETAVARLVRELEKGEDRGWRGGASGGGGGGEAVEGMGEGAAVTGERGD